MFRNHTVHIQQSFYFSHQNFPPLFYRKCILFCNPHKTSLYIRCELPVIIWDQAALSDFVRSNGIGICISSLAELDTILSSLTPAQYAKMKQNTVEISKRLSQGYYITKALSEVAF